MAFFNTLRRFGATTALADGPRSWSYDELADCADAVAAKLGAGRLVFLEARNSFDSIAAYLGCLVGGHPVYLYSPHDQDSMLRLAELYRPGAIVRGERAEIELRDDAPLALHPDLRVLLSTSGSTGTAKFVKLSERNIQSNAEAIAEYLELDTSSRAITSLKFNYSYGMSVINAHLQCGGSLLLTEASVTDPGFWPLFEAGGADSFAGVPYTFETLKRMNVPLFGFAGLRYFTQAGGRLSPELVRHFARESQASGRRFYVMYGQTEASPRIAYLPPALAEAFPDCIGVAIPGGRIDLLDAEGAAITAIDEPGELSFSGPGVMMGYAQARADLATDETPPRLSTGDIARRNADGLIQIVGRMARFVKPFGLRLNLDEVEAWVRTIQSDAVVAGDDDRIVVVLPERSAPAHPASVGDQVAAHFKLPAFAVQTRVVAEIPLLESGKVDYRALNAPAATSPDSGRARGVRSFLRTVAASGFVPQIGYEVLEILGLRRKAWGSVRSIYEGLVGRTVTSDQQSFVDLSGDSLTYVQVSLALEEHLGHLPDGWERMAIEELEKSDEMASI